MKKVKFQYLAYSLIILFVGILAESCASNKTMESGDEIVEFRRLQESKYLQSLSMEQIEEDCDMFKYLFYNGYAGYDEAVEAGFDMENVISTVQANMKKKTKDLKGLYSRDDFASELLNAFSKEFKVPDQHISFNGKNLKDTVKVYYSDVYLEKTEQGYFVRKSGSEKVKEGQLFTGNEANIFKMISAEGDEIFRYGVLTKQKIKSAYISVDNENVMISLKDDEPIPQKQAWNGLKVTKDTVYMSLSDCFDVSGLSDKAQFTEEIFNDYLKKLSVATCDKKNIIFDLRSNTGGYCEFPAKMLAAAYYNKHTDQEFQNNVWTLFDNSIKKNNKLLLSPLFAQKMIPVYKNQWKNTYSLFTEEKQKLFNEYFKKMEYKPIRKHISADTYKTDFTEFPKPDFQGNVYILINCRTASAAELGTGMAFYLKNQGINVQLVGENSMGAVKYVGMLNYTLPNSGIWMNMGSNYGLADIFAEIPQFMGEGKGFYPDYWTTNETILPTLVNITGDKALLEVLAGLEKNML